MSSPLNSLSKDQNASQSKPLSKKRQNPYSQEQINKFIIEQGVRRLKICSDLTNYIERIARSSVFRPAQEIEDDQNNRNPIRIRRVLPLNIKKHNALMNRKRIRLYPYQIKEIILLRYGQLNVQVNHKPLNKLKDICIKVGVKLSTLAHVLRRYRRNNYSIVFAPRIRKPWHFSKRKLKDLMVINYLKSKKVLRAWAHHSLLRRCQLIKDYFGIQLSRTTLANFYKNSRISYTAVKKTMVHKFTAQHLHIDRINFIDQITDYFLQGREIMYFDESSTHLWETRGKIWQPKDDKISIAIPSSRGSGVTLLATVSNKDEYFRFYIAPEGQSTCNKLVGEFFQNLNQHRSLDGVVIVLDRHPAHQLVTEQILMDLGCTVLKLPVNSSIFNPVEFCWAWVKHKWRNLLLQQDQDRLLSVDRSWMEAELKKICTSMPKSIIQAFIRSTTKTMYEFAKSEVPEPENPEEPRY